jgi:hypothetical protein
LLIVSLCLCTNAMGYQKNDKQHVKKSVFICKSLTDETSAQKKTTRFLKSAIEQTPVFKKTKSRSSVTGCSSTYEDSQLVLSYQFRNKGDILEVKYDPTIEYYALRLNLRLPATKNAEQLLRQTELSLFGEKGCGIDWRKSEIEQSSSVISHTEKSFEGAVCNCKAKIRSNPTGQTEELTLSRAC